MTDTGWTIARGTWRVHDPSAPLPDSFYWFSVSLPDVYGCCECDFTGTREVVEAHVDTEHPNPPAAAPRSGEADG